MSMSMLASTNPTWLSTPQVAVQLIDWGLAHQHELSPCGAVRPARLRSRCGSRSYMAPEVATLRGGWGGRGGREQRGVRGCDSGGCAAAPCAAAAVPPATPPVVGEGGEGGEGEGPRRERGYDGFAADVWSVGVCLFAMRAAWSDDATPRLNGPGPGCC